MVIAAMLYPTQAVAADAAESCSDVGARIKLLASRSSNAVITEGAATTYYIYSLKSPRGYRAVLAFTESPEGETVSVEIFESVRDSQRVTLLTDVAGDGKLDFSYAAIGPSIDDAFLLIKSGRGRREPVSKFESIYDALLFDLRREVPLESAAR